jgi:hypothetical protein
MPYSGGGDWKFEEISLIPTSENFCQACWDLNVIQVIISIITEATDFFINKKIILKTSHKILYLADISKFISFLTATGGIRYLSYKCFFRRSKKKESRQLTGFQI